MEVTSPTFTKGPAENCQSFAPSRKDLNFSQALAMARQGYAIRRAGHAGQMIVAKNAFLTVPGPDYITRSYHIPELIMIDRQDGKGFQTLTLDNSDLMALDYYVV